MMNFKLDSLQLLPQRMWRTKGSDNGPSWLIVDTYKVVDIHYGYCDRYDSILSDGHCIVKALLAIGINASGWVLESGDIIQINQYKRALSKDAYYVMISDFSVKHSRLDKPNGYP